MRFITLSPYLNLSLEFIEKLVALSYYKRNIERKNLAMR